MSFYENVNSKPVWKLFLWLSLPILVIAIINVAYNVIDYRLGGYINEFVSTAINISHPIQSFISIAGMVIGMSIATLLALNLGKGDESTAKHSMHQGILVAFLFCIIVAVIINLKFDYICGTLLGVKSQESPTFMYLKQFLKIGVYGQLIMVMNTCLLFALIAQGHPYAAMASTFAAVLVKLVFLGLLFSPLQISGVSWSAVLSQTFQMIFLLLFIKKKAILKFNVLYFKPSKTFLYMLVYITAYSLVYFIRPALLAIKFLNFTDADAILISGFAMVQTYVSIAFLFSTCIKQSFQIIIGYNYGSQSFKRIVSSFKIAVSFATIFPVLVFLLLQFFPRALLSVFYQDGFSGSTDELIKNIKTAVIFLPFSGFLIIAGNYLIMTGQVLKSILILLLHDFVIYLIWVSKKIDAIQSIPIYDFISILIIGIFTIFEIRKIVYKQKTCT